MNQIFEKILADYKKGNVSFKEKIILKYGFKTEAKLFAMLGYTPNSIRPNKIPIVKKPKVEVVPMQQPVDYVIAFDSTGSMSEYINNVKKHVTDLIPTLFADTPNLRMQIVVFGDYCDMTNQQTFGKAYQVSELSNNQQELINFVKSAKNTNGGDSDEFYELVIRKIVSETPWRNNSQRNVLFIGDCNPHPLGYTYGNIVKNNNIDWKLEAAEAASRNIKFDTMTIRPRYEAWYKELSRITGGLSVPFSSQEYTSNVIEALNAARYNKNKFMLMSTSSVVTSSVELSGAYKSMSTL